MTQNRPHQLSPEALREFKEIYLEEFGETLTDDEAEAIAMRVIRFFRILAQGTDRKESEKEVNLSEPSQIQEPPNFA
jgi:hypothetical protein